MEPHPPLEAISQKTNPHLTPNANMTSLFTPCRQTFYQSRHSQTQHPASLKMVRVKLAFSVALISRQDSGSKPIPDEVVGVAVGLVVLSIVGLIWLNVLIWKRAHRKAVEAVSAV